MDESQRKRINTESRDSKSKDIISSSPDKLLGRILSFLPTKCAVATTALSSRWKGLYKLTTTLDFDESPILVKLEDERRRTKGTADFDNIVNKILAECKTDISKFRLKCELPSENWIDVISAYKIAEFELSVLDDEVSYVMLLHKLKCENLVVLKLDGAMILNIRKSLTFPVLKVLFLIGIRFYGYGKPGSNQGLSEFLKGCPVLEELLIEGCDWNAGEYAELKFTNPLLRSFTYHSGVGGPLDHLNRVTLHTDLPSLVHLDYVESLPEYYNISNLNSVREANIDVYYNTDLFDEEELSGTILDLIKGVHRCQSLQLSSLSLEGLGRRFKLPKFCNLTQLHLTIASKVTWNDVLWDFLDSSSCLESLTLEQEHEDVLEWSWIQSNTVVPSCVKSHLKFIKLIGFNGFTEEMQMIQYFLENAKVLEEMVIHWDNQKRRAKEEKVLELPKSSKSCVISFK